jgi:hypothetical protein
LLREALGLARVDFDADAARAAWQSLSESTDETSGWTQGDAVQACCQLAMLRDNAAAWRYTRIAAFTTAGYVRTETAYGRAELGEVASRIQAAGMGALYRFGDSQIFAPPAPAGAGLDDDWHAQLARACDHVLAEVAGARLGPELPYAARPGSTFVLGPALPVAIIVAGAVMGVIGVVGVWRYFDPTLRALTLAVRAASEAYSERLGTWEDTGRMPPPSPLELAAVETVKAAAKDRGKSSLMFGLGVAGGIAVGTLAVAAISRAVSK